MAIRNPKGVKEALNPPKCRHPKANIEIHENRKGKKFKECNKCNAFLGWVR